MKKLLTSFTDFSIRLIFQFPWYESDLYGWKESHYYSHVWVMHVDTW